MTTAGFERWVPGFFLKAQEPAAAQCCRVLPECFFQALAPARERIGVKRWGITTRYRKATAQCPPSASQTAIFPIAQPDQPGAGYPVKPCWRVPGGGSLLPASRIGAFKPESPVFNFLKGKDNSILRDFLQVPSIYPRMGAPSLQSRPDPVAQMHNGGRLQVFQDAIESVWFPVPF